MEQGVNELELTRVETVVELKNEILKTIHRVGMAHGENDPEIDSIIASAYTMSILSIAKIYPDFVEFMIQMLELETDDE